MGIFVLVFNADADSNEPVDEEGEKKEAGEVKDEVWRKLNNDTEMWLREREREILFYP